jgi:hypothetical protein
MPNELTTTDTTRLRECEDKIDRSLRSFVDIGDALLEIRESRLYRDEHTTFERYCQARWNITKSRANQLISASRLVENLENEDANGVLPSSESVARELQRADADRQHDVWSQAVSSAPRGANNEAVVTARHVRETIEQLTTGTTPRPPTDESPRDGAGEQIPECVLPEYETGLELGRIASEVTQVAAKVRQMEGQRGMSLVSHQEIDRLLQQVREEIRFGAFHVVCPGCFGTGAIFDGNPCTNCRETGYLNRRMHAMHQPEQDEEVVV